MSKILSLLSAAIIASYMSVAMADNAADVYAQCKQDAASSEVSGDDMDGFIRKCMEDNGVEADDIDKVLKGASN